jgi:hypothetical protein
MICLDVWDKEGYTINMSTEQIQTNKTYTVDGAPVISSQAAVVSSIVAEKQASKTYLVKVVIVEIEDERYAVIADGHHALMAADRDGVDPVFCVANDSEGLTGQNFLDVRQMELSYYYVDSGYPVW